METAVRMPQGKDRRGNMGRKARARGLPVARGNKWSGREPGPLCRGAESTRIRPAQRLTKPTSIDRMKIESTEHRAMEERRTRTRPHAHTQNREQSVRANTEVYIDIYNEYLDKSYIAIWIICIF